MQAIKTRRPLKWTSLDQTRRRQLILDRQKQKRQIIVQQSRINDDQEEKKKQTIAMMQQPEWMYEIPDDFNSQWIAVLRPEGRRCILQSYHERTNVLFDIGNKFTFQSILPNGCSKRNSTGTTTTNTTRKTIVEAVFNSNQKIYYIVDVLMWDNFDMTHESAEFRFYWLNSKFDEIKHLDQSVLHPSLRIQIAPRIVVDQQLNLFMNDIQIFKMDGILFYHKHGHYNIEDGSSPLVLLWKDQNTCTYYRDLLNNAGISLKIISVSNTEVTLMSSEDTLIQIPLSQFTNNIQLRQLQNSINSIVKLKFHFTSHLSIYQVTVEQICNVLQVTEIESGKRHLLDSITKLLFLYGAIYGRLSSPYEQAEIEETHLMIQSEE
jgi:hypothetical protein